MKNCSVLKEMSVPFDVVVVGAGFAGLACAAALHANGIRVKVLEVDVARKRISLTMKMDAAPAHKDGPNSARSDNRFEHAGRDNRQRGGGGSYTAPPQAAAGSAMASAFAKLQGLKK